MRPKPIALLTIEDGVEDDARIGDVLAKLEEAGYLPLCISGRTSSVRILRADGMKRADYAVCKQAAQTMLNK